MKKILLAVALMIGACTFVACNGSSNADKATTDSVEVVVDSLAVDSVAADSIVADSVVADTVCHCSCEG